MLSLSFKLQHCADLYPKWGNLLVEEQYQYEDSLIKMSEQLFAAEKQKAKREHRFSSWDEWMRWARRLEDLRFQARKPKHRVIPVVNDEVANLIRLRTDYIASPWLYFKDKHEQTNTLYKLHDQIHKLPTGSYRLRLILEQEHRDAQPELKSIVQRLKSQLAAVNACKRLVAAKKIANFIIMLKILKEVDEQRNNVD